MRFSLFCFLFLSHVAGQAIIANSWLCDWIGIEGASKEMKHKYKTLVSHLNNDKTLKAQQERVENWILMHAEDLPELQKRIVLTDSNKVMVPRMKLPETESEMLGTIPMNDTVAKQVIENTIYNTKFWLGMRHRDVTLIKDILKRLEDVVDEEKLYEVKQLIFSEDRRFRNFYRPHHDVIKQLALARITNTNRKAFARDEFERAENNDDENEPGDSLMLLMEPMAAEFFEGCGV
ncbi:hypothetical protein PMAYCL1PPCAC_31619 [Pristionchus mayeri]|uniref:Uncharacterized protein n=1 Tax=Pristionchus mayeri TaxID=1317129 RepID=A0AAN5IEB8_9BILA|nr:hypothetical protein PMAYCL1PPCAC_31619 [Pristionchus mayeri]